MKLTLEGRQYQALFHAEEMHTTVRVGDHYYEREEPAYYWKGTGLIRKGGQIQRFLFRTTNWRKKQSLEESLIQFDRQYWKKQPEIVDKESVYDLLLQQMYNASQSKQDDEPVPDIRPEKLSYEICFDLGYLAEDEGQTRLNLTGGEKNGRML